MISLILFISAIMLTFYNNPSSVFLYAGGIFIGMIGLIAET